MAKQTTVIEISSRTIWHIAFLILGFMAIVRLQNLIFYLLFGLLFAVALSPLINWLQIKGFRRNSALALAISLFVAAVFALVGIVSVSLLDSITNFTSNLPQYIESFRQYSFSADYVDGALEAVDRINFGNILQTGILESSADLISGASKAFEAVLFTFFFTIYMLIEKDYLLRVSRSLVPHKWKSQSREIEEEFLEVVGNYIRGQVLTSFLMGLVSYLIFRMLGLPNAMALGVIAGLTDVIPVVGGLIGLIPATLVAFTISPMTAIVTIVLVQVYSTISNYFIRPRIFGSALDMSPFIVTVATMIGLLLFGIPGIILALPAAAMFGYILTEYYGVPLIEEDND